MNSKFNIKKEPIWEFEVACLISSKFVEEDKFIIENTEKPGIKKELILEHSEQFGKYRDIVLNEIMPIFKSKYGVLEQFFKPNLVGNSTVIDFVTEYIMNNYGEITDKITDDIMFEVLDSIACDFISISEEKCFKYSNISSVIDMLNKTNIEDKTKMQIINFYNDRYNLSKILINLLKEGSEILKKHFNLIEDDYNKAIKILENDEDLYDICSKVIGLQLPLAGIFDVHTIIFFFDQLSVHSLNENSKFFMCFIGIYVFEFYERKRDWKMNDTKIITDLKALGDATRYKIMCLLSKKSMYLQELANELNLTPATISHHTNTLLRSHLISITMDADGSKKIYYQINKIKIKELCVLIQELAE